ncbi:undecaprenyl-phosphate glucose phosphotransferase [Cupriavidus campinensis]
MYRFTDALIIGATGFAVGELVFPDGLQGAAPVHGFLTALCALGALLVFPACGLYGSWRGRSKAGLALRVLAAWVIVCLLALVAAFLLHQVGGVSRLWSVLWVAWSAIGLVASRVLLYGMLSSVRQQGINAKRVVILGYGPLGRDMYRRVQHIPGAGYDVVGIYDEAGATDLPGGVAPLATLDQVCAFVHARRVHEIWLTLPMAACRDLYSVVFHFRNDLVDIRWVPDIMSVELLGHRFSDFMGLPVIDLNSPPDSGVTGWVKASFDRVFAFAVLVGLSPLLAAIAIAVRLSSPGPVLFRQARLGMDGQPFHVYKFRSMVQHLDPGGVTQAARDDPRVTRVGAFLRRTSLDELPQFLNVLRGEMSVVGPRPHAIEHNELYKEIVDRYMLRHRVKPGITGWAQINGCRGRTDTVEKMRRRTEFDIFYIRNWSFVLDLRIIVYTAVHGWTGRDAF